MEQTPLTLLILPILLSDAELRTSIQTLLSFASGQVGCIEVQNLSCSQGWMTMLETFIQLTVSMTLIRVNLPPQWFMRQTLER
jgi:hypothetical protein